MALESLWRRPAAPDQVAEAPVAEAPSARTHRLGRGAQNALISVGIVLLWGLWVVRAMPSFWLVLEIERKLAEDGARPIIYYGRGATCWQPRVQGLTVMVNSIVNGWRMEDVWLDK